MPFPQAFIPWKRTRELMENILAKQSKRLSIGPVLYYWPEEQLRDLIGARAEMFLARPDELRNLDRERELEAHHCGLARQ